MMYQDSFVAVVKVGNRILRERDRSGDGAAVYLPFNSEYKIAMKNLHAQRAVVAISIDGVDVLSGHKLVLHAYNPRNPSWSEFDLERFIDDLDRGNRFRFIQKTKEISEARGDKLDDGIIRIEWQYELPVQSLGAIYTPRPNPFPYNQHTLFRSMNVGNSIGGSAQSVFNCSTDTVASASASCGDARNHVLNEVSYDSQHSVDCCFMDAVETPNADEGITVKGSVSNQQVATTTVGLLDSVKHVMTFMLRGTNEALAAVVEPLTVKSKIKCPTCGASQESDCNFCSKCSTALAVAI